MAAPWCFVQRLTCSYRWPQPRAPHQRSSAKSPCSRRHVTRVAPRPSSPGSRIASSKLRRSDGCFPCIEKLLFEEGVVAPGSAPLHPLRLHLFLAAELLLQAAPAPHSFCSGTSTPQRLCFDPGSARLVLPAPRPSARLGCLSSSRARSPAQPRQAPAGPAPTSASPSNRPPSQQIWALGRSEQIPLQSLYPVHVGLASVSAQCSFF